MSNDLDVIRQTIIGWWFRLFEHVSVRCQTCKEVLFVGRPDPLKKYSAGLGSWYGVPIAVCLGSWRNWWRRKWYHQSCCGVDTDRSNLAGSWHVFGFAPSEIQQYRIRALPSPLFSAKIGPSQYPSKAPADRERRA